MQALRIPIVTSFLKYNQTVILPTHTHLAKPADFHTGYRIAYIALCWVITASFLHHYSQLLLPLIPATSYGREFLICGGQILWQWPVVAMLHKNKTWDYLGNMMTISFVGGIALGIIQLIIPLENSPYIYGVLFSGVAGLMFLEHIRRSRILGISSWLTVSWILYRVVLLVIILLIAAVKQ